MLRIILFFLTLLLAFANIHATATAIIAGNPNGKIVVTEFADYGCPHCEKMQPVVAKFIRTHPQVKLRLVPVALVQTLSIPLAATALVVAEKTTAFAVFNSLAWSVGVSHRLTLTALWQAVGLKTQEKQLALFSQKIHQQMLANLHAFQSYGKGGVPLFIFSSQMKKKPVILRGEQSLTTLQEAYHVVR